MEDDEQLVVVLEEEQTNIRVGILILIETGLVLASSLPYNLLEYFCLTKYIFIF